MLTATNGMFDIDDLIRQADAEAAPIWEGAPLRYHEDYYTPAELDAAWERWKLENGSFGCIPYSHMWHYNSYHAPLKVAGHELRLYGADTRCDGGRFGKPGHQHAPGELPNELMAQAICEGCNWHHIADSDRAVIEAWHDHALPGWRELPVIPAKLRPIMDTPKAKARRLEWVLDHYPTEWQQEGYPVITERAGAGRACVMGASPLGGYDFPHDASRQ